MINIIYTKQSNIHAKDRPENSNIFNVLKIYNHNGKFTIASHILF